MYGRTLVYYLFSCDVCSVYSNLLRLRQDLQRNTPDVFVSVPLMLDSLQSRVRAWGCSLMQLGASAAVPGLSLHGACSPSCPTPFVALYCKRLPVLQPLSVACCYARCCPVAQAVKTLAKAREPQRKLAEALLGASGRYVKAARLLRGTDLRWVQAAECEGGRPSLCRCSQQWLATAAASWLLRSCQREARCMLQVAGAAIAWLGGA